MQRNSVKYKKNVNAITTKHASRMQSILLTLSPFIHMKYIAIKLLILLRGFQVYLKHT